MEKRVTSRGTMIAFASIVIGSYGIFLISSLPMALEHSLTALFLFIISQFFALGISIELAELLIAAVLPPLSHPILADVSTADIPIAALYLCRDDIDMDALCALQMLRGVDVYILVKELVDKTGLAVIRRKTRDGYKAGNLNHWLENYGHRYRYFIVLDSDSIVSTNSIWQLVRYAEHPANSDVAIVQSTIISRHGTCFQNFASGVSRLRHRVLDRLHGRIGWNLSQGHNNLHRISALNAVGGFDLSASCEDTIVSLRLMSTGWRIILVDAHTYDAEPRDVFAFRRRTVRWARQTVDVILSIRGNLGSRAALLLTKHLCAYLMAPAGVVTLAIFAAGLWRPNPNTLFEVALTAQTVRWLTPTTTAFWVAVFCLTGLRVWHWKAGGGTLFAFMQYTLMSSAVAMFTSFHITVGLVRSIFLGQTKFVPTGMTRCTDPGMVTFLRSLALPWFLCLAAAANLLIGGTPPGRVVAFLLLITGGTGPFVLVWFHRDQVTKIVS
jgi:Glycosyl transferase family 21